MRGIEECALAALGPALVGVSGGRDSVALLHLLVKSGARELVVAHLDHGLRAESAADVEFVAQFSASLGVECVIIREDVAAQAKKARRSFETAARQARYAFFARTAEKRRLTRLLLGHHADDQVETCLFNLLRGTGSRGFGGMRAVSTQRAGGFTLEVHRPLLRVWRAEIDQYLKEHAVPFRDDATNAGLLHTRNRLRLEVVPLLNRLMRRDVRPAIQRAADILAEEDAFLRELLVPSDGEPQLFVHAVRELPLAVQRRVLHAWLHCNGVRDLSFDDVERVRGLLAGRGAKTNLARGKHARRRAGRLFLEQDGATPTLGRACVSISAMNVPEELNYSTTDEWLRLDGANATVGITDRAQRELGEVAGVTLPQVGVQVIAEQPVGTIHSAAGDRPIHTPISGMIVAINEALIGSPRMINTDPYGDGWLFRISIEAGEEIEPLESAAQYRERLAGGGPMAMEL